MYNLFKKGNPNINVSFYFYHQYLRENFNYKFGRPQVDTCSTCEEIGAKLRSCLNDNAKHVFSTELLVHKRRSQKFYSEFKHVQSC